MHLFTITVVLSSFLFTSLSSIEAQEQCVTPNFNDGICISYKDCPFVIDLFAKYGAQIPNHFKNYIVESKCSDDGDPRIRLCCKVSKNSTTFKSPIPLEGTENAFNVDLKTNEDFLSQLNSEGFEILNKLTCGIDSSNRLAVGGGNETDLAEFPWMALLRYDVVSRDQYLCGGSLISNRFVLTATHCVNRPLQPLVGVRLGEHDLLKNEDCSIYDSTECNPPVEDFGIEKIMAHPNYSERKRTSDIALVKLDRNVEFKTHIGPICLPITKNAMEKSGLQAGYLISGWGTTESGSKSNVLLKAIVYHQERSTCQTAYRIEISQKHLCAGDPFTGRDTCRGDSGGPLMLLSKYKKFRRYIQYGVVAYGGISCDLSQGLPGIYTNVRNFLPWITDAIGKA